MTVTWMRIVLCFGGLKIVDGLLSIDPKLPKQWKGISFKINFKGDHLTIEIDGKNCEFTWSGNNPIDLNLRNKLITVNPKKLKKTIY